jgi:hypothetical protein
MSGAWTKLLSEDQVAQAVRAFERAVAGSFKTDGVLRLVKTEAEMRRRVEICARIFEQLRADANWSLPRIFDALPHFLRCELDEKPWSPSDRDSWTVVAT